MSGGLTNLRETWHPLPLELRDVMVVMMWSDILVSGFSVVWPACIVTQRSQLNRPGLRTINKTWSTLLIDKADFRLNMPSSKKQSFRWQPIHENTIRIVSLGAKWWRNYGLSCAILKKPARHCLLDIQRARRVPAKVLQKLKDDHSFFHHWLMQA